MPPFAVPVPLSLLDGLWVSAEIPAVAKSKGALVDINSATQKELDALPGNWRRLRAEAYRRVRPYRVKTDLVRKKIIPQATYDKIADKIIAKQKKQ